ncbi:MAG: DUF2961 domain-containing protein [Planctomycetes bacterium]|nr:DUF2961 domain-containing protein [Planctomycetota bacterium]
MTRLLRTSLALALSSASHLFAQVAAPPVRLQPRPGPDSELFSTLFPSRVHTYVKASSDPDDRLAARSRGNDDGFSGVNHCEAYRTNDNGTPVSILADFAGRAGVLGLFFRNFWSDSGGQPMFPGENNRTRVWIDGAVAHDRPLEEFFRNPGDPRGQIPPFAGPFTGHRAGGHLTHAQLRWQDSFRLGLDDDPFANASRFHRVAATLASPEGELPVPDMLAWEWIAEHPGQWPHQSVRNATTTVLSVPGNGGRTALQLAGPQTLLELKFTVATRPDWTRLYLRCTWDNAARPQVEIPLRMLGVMPMPPYSFPMRSPLLENDGDRTITCWFPMHFARHARIELENRGPQATSVTMTYATKAGPHPGDWGYFTAVLNEGTTGTGEPFQGPRLTDCKGLLRFLMIEECVDSTGRIPDMHLSHLEGDLCIRINGNRGDDHTFDASETGIGRWGWYLTPADQPFCRDTSFNSSYQLRPIPNGVEARRVTGSTFLFDPVHFVDGIDIVLEHGMQNDSNADYQVLAFFYVQPGAARRQIAEIDIGNVSPSDPRGEPAHGVQFTQWGTYTGYGNFFRDQFYGTPMVQDRVRHIRDFLRFQVRRTSDWAVNRPLSFGLRLDRFGGPGLGLCQADVLVDGQPAGLLHIATHNQVFQWKEGGECEVDLPRALTDGKASVTVELRPRAGSDPLKVARVFVYEYTK